MKKVYFSAVITLLFVVAFAIFKFGLKPRTISIMKPSYFSNPEEIGTVIFRRFYVELGKEKLVVFGVPAKASYQHHILEGLIKVAAHDGHPFDILVTDPRLLQPTSFPGLNIIPLSLNGEDLKDVVKLLQSSMAQQKHILVYTYSTMSSHLVRSNVIHKLERNLKQSIFSITSAPMSLAYDQEYALEPPCVGASRDDTGTADLGCKILQTSRMFYHRHFDPTRYIASIDQHGRTDYLLLSTGPKDLQNKAEAMTPEDLSKSSAFEGQNTNYSQEQNSGKKKKSPKYYDGSTLELRSKESTTTIIDPHEAVEEDVN